LKRQLEPDFGAVLGRAVDRELAAQQGHQRLADRQAKPGAGMTLRLAAVGLAERLAGGRKLLRRHADPGIRDA
jgi:hypothetical protein